MDYRFRRIGNLRPPAYMVETPGDNLGMIEAVADSGRGQSRSTNRYRAFPVTRRGHASSLALLATPDGYALSKRGTAFASRREAANAILAYLQEATA